MTNLKQSEILLGSQIGFFNYDFKPDLDTTFSGGGGGPANSMFSGSLIPRGIMPGGGFYYVQKLPLPLDTTFGFSVNVPFGGGANYVLAKSNFGQRKKSQTKP